MSNNIIKNEDKIINCWIIYYMLLGIIQALWTNQYAFPPMPLRIGMVFAVFAPAIIRYELVAFVIPFMIILRGNLSTAYQYLPDINTYSFYITTFISLLMIHYRKISISNFKYIRPLIILMIFMGIVDLLFNGEFGKYTMNIFMVVLYIPFLKTKKEFHLLSAALILVTSLLAVYYIIMYDKFLVTWSSTEGLERSGWNDPNYFSTLLDIGFFVAIMYIIGHIKGTYFIFNKKILIFVCAVIFTAVVMTASRAGFLCYIILLIILLVTTRMKWYWYLVGGVIISILVIYLYSNGAFDVLLFRLFEQGNADTGGGRTTIWEMGVNNFLLQPTSNQLFGGGHWHRSVLTRGMDPHNEFVSILLDYGFIGISLFLIMLFSMCSFKKNTFFLANISVIFYVILIMSLSPFQHMYIGFLLIWIALINKFSVSLKET